MSRKHSIRELDVYSGGTSPSAFTMQWNPTSRNTGVRWDEMVTGAIWTTPSSLHHQLYIAQNQGTEISMEQVTDFKVRAVCHFLIDHLPFEAFEELIPNLIELRTFHSTKLTPQVALVAPAKPAKVLSRIQRPPIEFSEE